MSRTGITHTCHTQASARWQAISKLASALSVPVLDVRVFFENCCRRSGGLSTGEVALLDSMRHLTSPNHHFLFEACDDSVAYVSASMPTLPVEMNTFAFADGDPAKVGAGPTGNFVYTFTITGPGGVTIPDAQFTNAASTATVTTTREQLNAADLRTKFGTSLVAGDFFEGSASDSGVQLMLHSIRRTPNPTPMIVVVAVTAGVEYRLQLTYHEQCCSRSVQVLVDGQLIEDEFSPQLPGGHVFVAQGSTATVVLESNDSSFADKNPVLNAMTLEVNPGDRRFYPSPLVYRLEADFHRNQGQVQAVFFPPPL